MTTPYVNESDMEPIREAFSADNSAPWGFAHNGIDFFPDGDLKPFQAVFSGAVEDIRLWQNSSSSNWQVNVVVRHDSTYWVEYGFEPMTTVQADGQTQLASISVSLGQDLSQGDPIGDLLAPNGNAHVHFSLYDATGAICPEPFFAQGARDSILRLIDAAYPGAGMCY